MANLSALAHERGRAGMDLRALPQSWRPQVHGLEQRQNQSTNAGKFVDALVGLNLGCRVGCMAPLYMHTIELLPCLRSQHVKTATPDEL